MKLKTCNEKLGAKLKRNRKKFNDVTVELIVHSHAVS